MDVYLLNSKQISQDFIDKNIDFVIDEKRKQKIIDSTILLKKQELMGAYLLLKNILKEKYNIKIEDLNIFYDNNNKPFFKNTPLNYSISHSNGIVIVAVVNKNIGIDIEKIDKQKIKIRNKILSNKEQDEYLNTCDKNKIHYFYQKWCLKEAYAKQTGKGINLYDLKKDALNGTTQIIKIDNDEYLIAVSDICDLNIIEWKIII